MSVVDREALKEAVESHESMWRAGALDYLTESSPIVAAVGGVLGEKAIKWCGTHKAPRCHSRDDMCLRVMSFDDASWEEERGTCAFVRVVVVPIGESRE